MALVVLLASLTALHGQTITVCTQNCAWFFRPDDPSEKSQVSGTRPSTLEEYQEKVGNLSKLLTDSGAEFFGLQELGGRPPLNDLAAVVGKAYGVETQTAFSRGKDTYTGQNVGAFLLRQKDRWKITEAGRVADLDRLVSKHLRVRLVFPNGRALNVLVVHLLRPIGKSAEKHRAQVEAINQWTAGAATASPQDGFVIMGDTNSNENPPAPFAIASWVDAFSIESVRSTHISGRGLYDRIVVSPNLALSKVKVLPLPLPKKPNESQQRVWTDHLTVTAQLSFR
jgi:endonuclease/exonuclease/phosphatase family metal-dependent hydrolase